MCASNFTGYLNYIMFLLLFNQSNIQWYIQNLWTLIQQQRLSMKRWVDHLVKICWGCEIFKLELLCIQKQFSPIWKTIVSLLDRLNRRFSSEDSKTNAQKLSPSRKRNLKNFFQSLLNKIWANIFVWVLCRYYCVYSEHFYHVHNFSIQFLFAYWFI